MSWTDKQSIKHIKKFRNKFDILTFVETGTHVGVNAELHASNFDEVLTCEKENKYYKKAKLRCKNLSNVFIYKKSSKKFLRQLKHKIDLDNEINPIYFIYLDAHFYDPKLEQPFVVLDELKALKDTPNCVIAIHDFDNGLGHITYDGQPLDFQLLKEDLLNVNPDFKFYTNELSSCDIKPLSEAEDWEEFTNLRYAWSKPEKTYRGILYCSPKKVNIKGLKQIWS